MDAPDLETFRDGVVAFLDAHHARRAPGTVSSDRISVIPERTEQEEAHELARARAWRATVFDAGYGWVDGPVEHGGQGLDAQHAAVYRALEMAYDVPDEGYTRFSVGIFTPTLLAHATSALSLQYLRALRRADLVACQLFSEPDAGSDLASVRTRAVLDGDAWRVDGQKVWTSGAHYSEVGLLLARTGTTGPKHAGLTAFLVDMASPGVLVRPIRQLTGGASFSEVFLDDVRVPDTHRIGEVGEGWRVITTTLMHERAVIGSDGAVDVSLVPRLVEAAKRSGRWDDPLVRDAVAEVHVRAEANALMTQRFLRLAGDSGLPGPEMSLSKLLLTDNLQRISVLVQDLLGPAFTADTGEWGTYGWNQLALTLPGLRIGGGTDEVLRTIVATRVLGLPR